MPTHLCTDHGLTTLGIDAVPPRFSWRHDGEGPQSAYQIQVFSSEEKVRANAADLWDSGRKAEPTHTFVPYDGVPLVSGQKAWWRVRTWNAQGIERTSEDAWFEMGLLRREDWQGRFLTIPRSGAGGRGYHSHVFMSGETGPLWVQVDLGRPEGFDRLVIHSCYYREQGPEAGPGFGFPVRFRVETSNTADFAKACVVFETPADIPNPGLTPFEIRLSEPRTARHVRITVTKPFMLAGDIRLLALDEIQVFRGAANLALGKPCTAANHLFSRVAPSGVDWLVDCLTDGVIHVEEPRIVQVAGSLLRRKFTLPKPAVRARAYLAVRGWAELRINGQRVGDAVLNTARTVVEKRLFYSTWDVTELLRDGGNVVTVLLGAGWVAAPAFILQMNVDYADGSRATVFSDGSWRRLPSPVREDNVYHGETYDARLENPAIDTTAFDDSAFPAATVVEEYTPRLEFQGLPPIRVTETLPVQAMTQPQPGVWVFDLGQNIAGWARLHARGEPGQEFRLRFAESIFDDGSVWTDVEQTRARREGKLCVADGMINNANYRSARATDRYLCKGGGDEVWEPRFTYHGFRFVELTGCAAAPAKDSIEGRVVHTDVRSIGRFECSNPVLNWATQAARWTILNNLHSVPSDCCQRDERHGWLGDTHIICEATLFHFDAAGVYDKWIGDIVDEQSSDGAVTDTAPYSVGRMAGDVGWGCTLILVPWTLYLHTGDKAILTRHYAAMRAYLKHLDRRFPSRFVDDSLFGGDWLSLEDTPASLTHTGFLLLSAQVMAFCAQALGKEADAECWRAIARETTAVFNERFFDARTAQYGSGSQFSNAWALYLGVVPADRREEVFRNLVANVEQRSGHLSTGIIGTKFLLETLSDNGRTDLAYAVASARDFPGYGYMQAHGATTLWEHWPLKTGNGMNSHAHPVQGHVAAWMMKYLAGIRPDAEKPGFERVIFAPSFPAGLDHAAGEVETLHGMVRSAWRRQGSAVELEITVPDGAIGCLQLGKNDRCIPCPSDGRLLPGTHRFRSGNSSA